MKIREHKVRKYAKGYSKAIGSERVGGEWIMSNVTSTEINNAVRWYFTARADCQAIADKHDIPLAVACGVVAAWSPRMRWNLNIQVADQHLRGKKRLGMQSSANRADRVLVHGIDALNTPTGQKTYNFAWNLFGDTHAVTIDTWMLTAAGLEQDGVSSRLMYEELSRAVRRLAKRHGMQPAEMQALIWIKVRGSAV